MNDIWMYWESKDGKVPAHIQLCIDSVFRHKGSLRVHVLDRFTVRKHVASVHSNWERLHKPAHRADYIRTRLVYQYGGMWLDCDMLALKSLEPLLQIPDDLDYACRNISTSIGCFVGRPGCKLLHDVMAAQDEILSKDLENFGWNGLGNELMKKYGDGYPHLKWPEHTIDSIAGGKVSKLLSKEETIESNVHPDAVIFHLCNENSGPLIMKYLSEKKLLTSNTLVSKIYRLALDANEKPRRLPFPLSMLRNLR